MVEWVIAAYEVVSGWLASSTIASFAARTMLTIGLSKLVANRTGTNAAGSQSSNARTQVPASTSNPLGVVYGSAFVAATVTDAKLSSDQKTMWYVMALSEVTGTMPGQTPDTYTFGNMYCNGNLITFDETDPAKVIKLTTNSTPPQEDTTISGNMYIYKFTNGSSSGVNTGGQTAIQIMSQEDIPADERWNSAMYTAGGQSAQMANTAFIIVKIIYNKDNQATTSLPTFNVQLQNPRNKPGDVFYDYFLNNRYGCAIPLSKIDTASLTQLNTYSNELIDYRSTYGGIETQARYRINGPIDTGQNCLTNLQVIADSCDSWLQYSELTGKWKIVINQSYTDYATLGELFLVDSNNLIGGIDINPLDLNQTYNSLQISYPDANIKDQTNYNTINLIDYLPGLMSPNESDNQLVINYPIINNYVQATYLGERRLLQSREDLVIVCQLDYSGIQIEAGDVIKVDLAEYGWGALPLDPENPSKLFRVTQVQETKSDNTSLGVRITAIEYNDTIYANDPIQNFVPAANTGLKNPNIIGTPGAPTVTTVTTPNTDGQLNYFNVSATVPATGTVLYMDFYYGTSTDASTHKLYRTVTPSSGRAFVNGSTVTIAVNDLPPGTYYWSVKARSSVTIAGASGGTSASSPSSASPLNWLGAALLAPAIISGILKGGIATGLIQNGAITNDKLSPALQGNIKTLLFNPANNGGTTPDITTLSFTDRNRPCTIPGFDVDPDQIFPWYQGTNSTSTGPWLPAGARADGVDEGEQGWYKAVYWSVADDPVIPDVDYYTVSMRLAFMSDTPNTIFQVISYVRFTDTASDRMILQQGAVFGTYTITSEEPYPFTIAINDFNGTTGATGIEIGYAVRNMTVGSTLTLFGGSGVYDARAWPVPFNPS
jgi:hypothetical protein